MTEDGGRKTEDGGRRTEDGGRRTALRRAQGGGGQRARRFARGNSRVVSQRHKGHSAAKPQPKELEPQGTAKQENRKHRKTRKAKSKPGNELGRKTCANKAKWPDSSTEEQPVYGIPIRGKSPRPSQSLFRVLREFRGQGFPGSFLCSCWFPFPRLRVVCALCVSCVMDLRFLFVPTPRAGNPEKCRGKACQGGWACIIFKLRRIAG